MKEVFTTKELSGVSVALAQKPQKVVGKVHSFIFHPTQCRVVGFTVKRPDVALMFHRGEIFVALDAFTIKDGILIVSDERQATDKAACKRLGIDWDSCIIWQGLPLLTAKGKRIGYVGDVSFFLETGEVISLKVDRGKSAELLIGVTELPAEVIKGFTFGAGDALNTLADDQEIKGGIVVFDEALSYSAEGGVAERMGSASAVGMHKVSQAIDKTKPVRQEAAKKTSDAVNRGAFALGHKLSETKGMFSNFKKEYKKARYEEDSQQ